MCSIELHAVAAPRDGLPAPQHPPGLDVLLEAAGAAAMIHPAGGPLALGGGQAPPDAEPQHDPSARKLIQVADLMSQDHRCRSAGSSTAVPRRTRSVMAAT